MKKKQILILDNTYPKAYQLSTLKEQGIGGTESSVVKTALILSSQHQVYVAQKYRTETTIENENCRFIPKSEINKLKPDDIIVLRKYSVLKEMHDLFPKARLFLWLHTYKNREYAFKKRGLDKLNVAIICNSKTHQTHIDKLLNKSILSWLINLLVKNIQTTHCYNPIDKPNPNNPRILRDNNKLLFFSSPNKGLEQVLKCFNEVRKELPRLKLYIANPGYKKDDKLIDKKSIEILGSLPHSQMMKHVQDSLCVFYPQNTFAETFGLIYAEANSYETAVLAHDIGAAREILDNNNRLIDVTDTKAVIKTLKQWQNSYPKIKHNDAFSDSNILNQWNKIL